MMTIFPIKRSIKEINRKEEVISYIELRKEYPYLPELNSKLDNLLLYKDHQLVGSIALLEVGYHKVLLERVAGNLNVQEKKAFYQQVKKETEARLKPCSFLVREESEFE